PEYDQATTRNRHHTAGEKMQHDAETTSAIPSETAALAGDVACAATITTRSQRTLTPRGNQERAVYKSPFFGMAHETAAPLEPHRNSVSHLITNRPMDDYHEHDLNFPPKICTNTG